MKQRYIVHVDIASNLGERFFIYLNIILQIETHPLLSPIHATFFSVFSAHAPNSFGKSKCKSNIWHTSSVSYADSVFHLRTVLSSDTEIIFFPSLLIDTLLAILSRPFNGSPMIHPDYVFHSFIVRTRNYGLTVLTYGQARN